MLDATFIKPASRHLAEARQIRRDLPKLKAMLARYHHISPADKAREVERMRERFFQHVAWARYHTAKGQHYTRGDNLLRLAEKLQDPIASHVRDLARQTFDRAESLPIPSL